MAFRTIKRNPTYCPYCNRKLGHASFVSARQYRRHLVKCKGNVPAEFRRG